MNRQRCKYSIGIVLLFFLFLCSCEYINVPKSQEILICSLGAPDSVKIYTANGDFLLVLMQGDHYLWNWNDSTSSAKKIEPNKLPLRGSKLLDGELLLVSDYFENNRNIYLQNIFSGQIVSHWDLTADNLFLLDTGNSRNGKYVAVILADREGKKDNQLCVISKDTGDFLNYIDAKDKFRRDAVTVSDDGRYVAISPYIYDMQTKKRIELERSFVWEKDAKEIRITSDNQRVFCGGWTRKTVAAYELATGNLLHEYELNIKSHNKYPIVGMDVSPDGRWLVASTYEPDLIHLWDLRTDQKVGLWKGTVQNIAFAPDSQRFAALSRVTGEIHIYKIPENLQSLK